MKFFHDDLLSTVAHASNRLGPLTDLIDSIVDRLAPKTTALAYSPCDSAYTHYCGADCSANSCSQDPSRTGLLTSWSNTSTCNGFELVYCDAGCDC